MADKPFFIVNPRGVVQSVTEEHGRFLLENQADYKKATQAEIDKWWAAQGLGSESARKRASDEEGSYETPIVVTSGPRKATVPTVTTAADKSDKAVEDELEPATAPAPSTAPPVLPPPPVAADKRRKPKGAKTSRQLAKEKARGKAGAATTDK